MRGGDQARSQCPPAAAKEQPAFHAGSSGTTAGIGFFPARQRHDGREEHRSNRTTIMQTTKTMDTPKVVSPQEWEAARQKLRV
ncbi:MAG TPA: hypothetical protein VF051_03450, partial [Hyphomicrobiaceae bacterium]